MRCAVVLVVLAGCGFQGNGAGDQPQPADAAVAIDAPFPDPDATVKTDAIAAQPYCNPDDGDLIACYEFENNTNDPSSNHLDAAMTTVSYGNGKFGRALQVGDNSSGDTADKPVLDVAALTIEAWINPTQLPDESNKAYVVDVNSQYALHLDHDGHLFCTLSGGPSVSTLTPDIQVQTGRWTHVACTFDGTKSVIYVTGAVANNNPAGGALATSGTTGLSIGGENPSSSGNGRFNGMIDQLRLMKVARTAVQICIDSGKTLCL